MLSVPTLVLGGNGRLADRLRSYLPAQTRYAARTTKDGRCIAIGNYSTVPPTLFHGSDTIINCTGISHGSPAALWEANVETSVHLATMARSAGARRFVHVSSFSVLGLTQNIVADSPSAPVNAYGRSKLAAEQALWALGTENFAVVTVRLPALIGGGGRDKLRRLIAIWLRLRRLPVPRKKVERSMISVDLAARVLAVVARGRARGLVHAADSELFNYHRAAAEITRASGRRVGLLILPEVVVGAMGIAGRSLFSSLYTSNVLAPRDNCAEELPSDLYQTIALMAQQEALI